MSNAPNLSERITDPSKIPVQMNVRIPFEFREHLYRIAEVSGVSVTKLVFTALQAHYPMGEARGSKPNTAQPEGSA